ncbi:MAG: hypothetical protein IIV98_03435, partial [Aeriscardovia sp.]|nr:hypothetical protein [Aeriscardovia sp.]
PQFCAALDEADSYFSNRGFEMGMSQEDKVEVAQFIIDHFYENCERDGLPPFAAFAKAKAAATKRLRAPAHFPSSLLKARRVRQG